MKKIAIILTMLAAFPAFANNLNKLQRLASVIESSHRILVKYRPIGFLEPKKDLCKLSKEMRYDLAIVSKALATASTSFNLNDVKSALQANFRHIEHIYQEDLETVRDLLVSARQLRACQPGGDEQNRNDGKPYYNGLADSIYGLTFSLAATYGEVARLIDSSTLNK